MQKPIGPFFRQNELDLYVRGLQAINPAISLLQVAGDDSVGWRGEVEIPAVREVTERDQLIESLRWQKIPCLSDGYVCLVDVFGDDQAVVQAARVCYGEGTKKTSDDRRLIRYLMRHEHGTPFEMPEIKFMIRIPMDAHRQLIRHRTACLSGDTELHFDLPGGIERRGNQLYKLTVKQVFDKFQPTVGTQGDAAFKRARVQSMQLRCLNEETKEPTHTQIVDIWESGKKPVYLVTTQGGASVKMSGDHLCLTCTGWQRLRDFAELDPVNPQANPLVELAAIGPGRDTGVQPTLNTVDDTEEWAAVVGWESYYEVSSQGRVRRIVGGKGSRSHGRCKQITVFKGRAMTSLNRPGLQEVHHVSKLMLEAFVGPAEPGQECCHEDGNSLNNLLTNLRWGSKQSNADDRVRDGATTALTCNWERIASISYAGEEMTYDLEVSGPWHNFSAAGMIVHNSVNEYSTRYSIAIDSADTTEPDGWRIQSTTNKQGSGGALAEWPKGWVYDAAKRQATYTDPKNGLPTVWTGVDSIGDVLSMEEDTLLKNARETYEFRVANGVAREQARKDLPLSTYTELYWKCDLRNILHFLGLRMDSHAQLEIRTYANAIGSIVEKLFPLTYEAFVDYRLEAMTLSRVELGMLQRASAGRESALSRWEAIQLEAVSIWPEGKNQERDEFYAKCRRMGVAVP